MKASNGVRQAFILPVVLLLATALLPIKAVARLGESEDAALARADQWRNQYGAVQPIVDVNDSRLVWQECWSAPPQGWTPTEAIEFARQLIPNGRSTKITRLDAVGAKLRYSAGDKYLVLLRHSNTTVYDIEVVAKTYDGTHC